MRPLMDYAHYIKKEIVFLAKILSQFDSFRTLFQKDLASLFSNSNNLLPLYFTLILSFIRFTNPLKLGNYLVFTKMVLRAGFDNYISYSEILSFCH